MKNKLYTPNEIANFFIEKAFNEKNNTLTPMKLQKVLFFTQGWSLALRNSPIFSDRFVAWDYGPVLVSLYREFKHFGRNSITEFAHDYIGNKFVTPKISKEDKETRDFLEKIWQVLKDAGAVQLSNLTHATSSPWDNAKNREDAIIRDDEIKEYFIKNYVKE